MNMGEQTVPVLLITANVGSVFENVSFCARFISFLIENSFPSEMGKMSLHVGNQFKFLQDLSTDCWLFLAENMVDHRLCRLDFFCDNVLFEDDCLNKCEKRGILFCFLIEFVYKRRLWFVFPCWQLSTALKCSVRSSVSFVARWSWERLDSRNSRCKYLSTWK